MPPTTPVHVRIDSQQLDQLEELGKQARPKALNRSEMINVAVAEYVARHAAKPGRAKREPANAEG